MTDYKKIVFALNLHPSVKPILVGFLVLFLPGCGTHKVETTYPVVSADRIDSLILHKNYFKARELFEQEIQEISPYHQRRFEAYLGNVYNRPGDSNSSIDVLFSEYEKELSDSLKAELMEIQSQNCMKLQDYEKAVAIATRQLEEYQHLYTAEELVSMKNTLQIWKGLVDQPMQKLDIPGRQVIPLTRDKAGLSNLPVTFGEDSLGFIFDTGANISTVTASTAQAMGMRMLDASFTVKAISGIDVNSGLAIAPSFFIGGILIENAVFLVLPDSALTFPQIDYRILGIIGYPVMAAMEEIQLVKGSSLIVPARSSSTSIRNLAMEFLTPLIQLPSEEDTLVFKFDTGADGTTLYRDYYLRHKEKVESTYTPTMISLGGAGGKAEVEAYKINLPLTINDRQVLLDSVDLIKENLTKNENIYGNIGQDLVAKFDTLIINFEEMFILLK